MGDNGVQWGSGAGCGRLRRARWQENEEEGGTTGRGLDGSERLWTAVGVGGGQQRSAETGEDWQRSAEGGRGGKVVEV